MFDLLTVVEENICSVDMLQSGQMNSCLSRENILEQYADLFEGQGKLPGLVHLDVDETIRPVHMLLRRSPIAIQEKVRGELEKLTSEGIIRQVTEPSAWISALLVVMKPSGQIRLCIDPRPLNKALLRSHYKMPVIDDILSQLTNAKVYSTFDLKKWILAFGT